MRRRGGYVAFHSGGLNINLQFGNVSIRFGSADDNAVQAGNHASNNVVYPFGVEVRGAGLSG